MLFCICIWTEQYEVLHIWDLINLLILCMASAKVIKSKSCHKKRMTCQMDLQTQVARP